MKWLMLTVYVGAGTQLKVPNGRCRLRRGGAWYSLVYVRSTREGALQSIQGHLLAHEAGDDRFHRNRLSCSVPAPQTLQNLSYWTQKHISAQKIDFS
jgi:hypothetical protein